jgi:hypothetical protein
LAGLGQFLQLVEKLPLLKLVRMPAEWLRLRLMVTPSMSGDPYTPIPAAA